MKNLGIIMVVLGLVMMLITGFNYVTQEKVVDLGKVEINKTENHPVRWSPIVGAVLLGGGVLLIIMNSKKVA